MAEGGQQITKRRRLDSDGIAVDKKAEEKKSPSPAAEEVAENNVIGGSEEEIRNSSPVAEEVAENNVAGGCEEGDIFDWLNKKTLAELWEIIDSLPELNCNVKFIDDQYVPPVIVQSSSDYVTINGNEESCGSSFSESESSVMASIDRCSARSAVSEVGGGAWRSDEVKAVLDDMERFLIGEPDGCDSSEQFDHDDEWVKCVSEDLYGGSK